MAKILSVSGSHSPISLTTQLLRHLDNRLAAQGHDVHQLNACALPAAPLLGIGLPHLDISRAIRLFDEADGIIVGTPICKASYSGLLKALLDRLPQNALKGKTVLPLATSNSLTQALAIDYSLRPVLSSMGAARIIQSHIILNRCLIMQQDGTFHLAHHAASALYDDIDQFSDASNIATPSTIICKAGVTGKGSATGKK